MSEYDYSNVSRFAHAAVRLIVSGKTDFIFVFPSGSALVCTPDGDRGLSVRLVESEGVCIAGGSPSAPDESSAILSRSIDTLPIGTMAQNALEFCGGIGTIGDLVGRTADELLNIRQFGAGSLTKVRAALSHLGLKLKDD